jgi:probable HAF family extracellular repeat protein
VTAQLNRFRPVFALFAFCVAAATTVAGQGRTSQLYSITDLGTLGGSSSEALGLNLFGDVVGTAATSTGASHAFLYKDGQMIDLGTLPGGTTSAATAITDQGTIIGRSGINGFGPNFREVPQAFIWQDGTMRTLGALYCPCTFNTRYGTSSANAINALGRVVGDSKMSNPTMTHAFVWQPNAMTDFGNVLARTASSAAYGINERGEVVGEVDGHAFYVHDGVWEDLGTLGGDAASRARAINRLGEVVGSSVTADGVSRAFLWDRGTMVALDALPGYPASDAMAIGQSGLIVGRSGNADFSSSRAVLWADGAAIDLNARIPQDGWVLTRATAINDVDQIAGVGVRNGEAHAVLLTPR